MMPQVIDLTSGEPVDAYQTGEIVVQSRSAMKSYFGRPEATAEALSSDGWLRTGKELIQFSFCVKSSKH